LAGHLPNTLYKITPHRIYNVDVSTVPKSRSKESKNAQSAGKVMASVLWDSKGILLIDYLQKGKTITGQYYTTLLEKLKTAIQEKRPGMAKKKVLFHHDNAPSNFLRIHRIRGSPRLSVLPKTEKIFGWKKISVERRGDRCGKQLF
jgi:hypothetical protein